MDVHRSKPTPLWRSAALAALLLGSIGAAPAQTPLPSSLVSAVASSFLHGPHTPLGAAELDTLATVQGVYAEWGFAPLWVEPDGPRPPALDLASQLTALAEDGLDPEDYGASAINDLLRDVSRPGVPATLEALAELEVRLSLALVRAASDLASGRLEPQRVHPRAYVYPQDVEPAAVLRAVRARPDAGRFLHSFEPAQENYHRLKKGLAEYRAMAATLHWTPLADGPTLEEDVSDPRVPRLRERLAALGDLSAGADQRGDTPFDAALAAAVRRFQDRHGLEPDGRVGRRTLAALNVPLAARVDQMVLNMERRRWMPDRFEPRYVFVNLADFELKVVDTLEGRERTIHTTEVVVGKPYHQTPEFSHRIRYLVFNPYWNVPPSIARREILPKVQADPGYLAAHHFEVLSGWDQAARRVDPATVDWASLDAGSFAFKLRQAPGPENALGRVKFVFPNPYNIYLHDTPARELFERTSRAFSHGCIRVKDPVRLAHVLLHWQEGWPLTRVEETIASGERTVVTLAEPVPVHLAYITAWVNKDGTVHFRDDVYGRDAMLARALLGRELDLARESGKHVPPSRG